MESQIEIALTVISLNVDQASVLGCNYIARFEPSGKAAFWFAAEGQSVIWSVFANSEIVFDWLPVETELQAKGASKGRITTDAEKVEALRIAVTTPEDKHVDQQKRSANLLGS